MNLFSKKNYILPILLHLIIAIPFAYVLNIWIDEASTLYTTRDGFWTAWQTAATNERQAALYFWILSLWRSLNDSVLWARLFSVVCSCLAIYFFSGLARRVLGGKAAVFAVFVFALHPYLIWTSLEIRGYALVILLSILLLKFFGQGYLKFDLSESGKDEKPARIFYALIAVVALYANYYLGFILVGCFIALLVNKKWREAKIYFLQMLAVGAAFLPALWTIWKQVSVNTSGFQAARTLSEGLRLLQGAFLSFVLPTELFPSGETASAISVFRVWFVRLAILAIIVLIIKNRRKLNEKIYAFGAISAVVCLFLLTSYFLLGTIYLGLRHATILFVPLFLFGGLILQAILETKDGEKAENNIRYALTIFLTVIFAAFFSYSIYNLYPNLTKRGDWSRIAHFIKENEKPNQPIAVFMNFDVLALKVYYRGENRLLPAEKFFDWRPEGEPGTADRHRRQIDFIISEIPPDASEVWILTEEICQISAACEPLENFVQSNYTIVLEKDFYKEKVRLLRKK